MKLSSNRITFAICFLGIFVSYFVYGVLQENMYVAILLFLFMIQRGHGLRLRVKGGRADLRI